MLKSAILLVTTVSVVFGVDRTTEEGASGADVVQATIAKIESSGVFEFDGRLLRRIAYVETVDGAVSPPSGGIWNVSVEAFVDTQQNYRTAPLRMKINSAFSSELDLSNVNSYESLNSQDLRRPLWSALAARLVLYLIERRTLGSVPTSSDVSGQAVFWSTYYGTEGDVNKFINDVQELEDDEGMYFIMLNCV